MEPKRVQKVWSTLRCQLATALLNLVLLSTALLWVYLNSGKLPQREFEAVRQRYGCGTQGLGGAKGCLIGRKHLEGGAGGNEALLGLVERIEGVALEGVGDSRVAIKSRRPLPSCRADELVFVYEMPSEFNAEILGTPCLDGLWSQHPRNACEVYSPVHGGIGPPLKGDETVFLNALGSPPSSWADTGQFALEVMFHEYMAAWYPCRTFNPDEAAAFYVPLYAGMAHAAQSIDCETRNCPEVPPLEELGHRLGAWLNQFPYLKRFDGRDHFTTVGRCSWDVTQPFTCCTTGLLNTEHTRNMVMLGIESTDKADKDRQISVPYPTCFHPASPSELAAQQKLLVTSPRPVLASFVGQLLRGGLGWGKGLRAALKTECDKRPEQCRTLSCHMECHCTQVLAEQLRAKFCLQPSGDSPTRRSTFDALQAGCIPVLFHRRSAYDEYPAFLPPDEDSYSVFVSEDSIVSGQLNLLDHLASIPEEELIKKRQVIAAMLANISYADHRRSLQSSRDSPIRYADQHKLSEYPISQAQELGAYGVALTEALQRIQRRRTFDIEQAGPLEQSKRRLMSSLT